MSRDSFIHKHPILLVLTSKRRQSNSSAACGILRRSTVRSHHDQQNFPALNEQEGLQACSARGIPGEDKKANESPYEDADEYVPIIIHGQQHNHVRNRELQRVDARANSLLIYGWDVTSSSRRERPLPISQQGDSRMRWVFHLDNVIGATGAIILVSFRITGSTTCPRSSGHGTLLDQAIVFALQAAQEFEKKDKADDADA